MSRTLFVIGAGIEAVPGILTARQMGLHVVCSDGRGDAPGLSVANDVMVVSTYDIEGTVAAARNYSRRVRPIDGVICIACDCFLTVSIVADQLGLRGIPVGLAEILASKLVMKEKLAQAGVPVPRFSLVESEQHLRELVKREGLPLVIKPVDSRGARGVLRLTGNVDLSWAYEIARGASPTSQVIAERFLPGPQVSTESLVADGVVSTPGFSDRNYEFMELFAPFIIENGGELPSRLEEAAQRAVLQLVEQAIHGLGIKNATVKGDVVLSAGRPYIIELAPRLSGGYFCTHEIPLNTGIDFVRQAIELALGDELLPEDLKPRHLRAVAERYLFPRPGRVVSVQGQEKVAAWRGIELCEVRVQPGDLVPAIDSHPARAGVVIATGETRAQAAERARAAVDAIVIETAGTDPMGQFP